MTPESLGIPVEFLDRVDDTQCAAWWRRFRQDTEPERGPLVDACHAAYLAHRRERLADRGGTPLDRKGVELRTGAKLVAK